MKNEVRMPIETTRVGDEITKVCVEDVYKIINRITNIMDKHYNNSMEILDSIHKTYGEYEGELIIGKGVSKPCEGEEFNEDIGNDIAFIKAKLNANIKKHNFIVGVYKEFFDAMQEIDFELAKVDDYIRMDLYQMRNNYNPEYLPNIEQKLGA